jgi:pyruvate-formate lyase-activating enzyme
MDPKQKFFLFHKNQNFCAAPWNHIEVWSNGAISTCSKGMEYGRITNEKIEDILVSDTIKNIKSDLLANRPNSNCEGCHKWSTEQKHYDLRNHYNPMFKEFDVDYSDVEKFELHGIDLHWNNTCNFKCIYCNAEQSSAIAQEQQVTVARIDNFNIEYIIDQVEKNQYKMKEIYLTGGEPLLIKHNHLLLSKITNTDLPIRVNSNISMITDSNLVFAELKRFKNVLWTISADSQGNRFNYVRHGGDWNQFLINLAKLKSIGHKLRINLVWFVGNVSCMAETIEFFIQEHGITDITINQLDEHEYLLARHAPVAVKQQAKIQLDRLLNSGLIDPESNSWYNIARCVRELDTESDNPTGYCDYFDKLDRLRGTQWRSIFTELVV